MRPETKLGSIKSVYCKGFVTYEECLFLPSEYLNIIIGPNGTGKSTLVSAIVLGLGGDQWILSRGFAIQNYIKSGHLYAVIKVEIFTNEKGATAVFERHISKTGKSDFVINGIKKRKVDFLLVVAKYNIEVNNLCQFLPQDCVQDFLKMNPQEMLEHTIKSVRNENVSTNFTKLKELRTNQITQKKTLADDTKKLEEYTRRTEELYQTLESYKIRKKIATDLEICEARKAWLEVEQLHKEKNCHILRSKSAKEILKEHVISYNDVIMEHTDIKKTGTEIKQIINCSNREIGDGLRKKDAILRKVNKFKLAIRKAQLNCEKEIREHLYLRSKLREETKMLQIIISDLQNVSNELGSQQKLKECIKEIEECVLGLKIEISDNIIKRVELSKKLDEQYIPQVNNVKNQINNSHNIYDRKLEVLRNKYFNLYTGVHWLNANLNLFNGRIYKPMFLEINIRDPLNIKYFENTISIRDLLAFTCENKADVSMLVNELCVKQNLTMINVLHSPPANDLKFTSNIPIDDLRQFGFHSYMIDFIEGPNSILNYLCNMYNIHNIPIGNSNVNDCTESLPLNIRQYFGGDKKYTVIISKYSKQSSLMQVVLKTGGLLFSVDTQKLLQQTTILGELCKLIDELKYERTVIEAKIEELELQKNLKKKEKRLMESKLIRITKLATQLERQKQKIASIKENSASINEIQHTLKSAVTRYLEAMFDLYKKYLLHIQLYTNMWMNMRREKKTRELYKLQNKIILSKISMAMQKKLNSEKLYKVISRDTNNIEIKYKLKKTEALSLTNNFLPSDDNFPHKDIFKRIPNNIDEIKVLINDYNARLNCIGDINPEIVNVYGRVSHSIVELKKVIEKGVRQDEKITQEINRIYFLWYREICQVIKILNEQFSDFMKTMGYVGEVILCKQNDLDFDSYGIKIMVQYRKDVPLQVLNRFIQSGGERAVAIAVYTLSLQYITQVPFRCVDEINQGMDAINERKVFGMLLCETTKTGRSQYFFVSPKLLPNLLFNRKISVHILFNGKMVESCNTF